MHVFKVITSDSSSRSSESESEQNIETVNKRGSEIPDDSELGDIVRKKLKVEELEIQNLSKNEYPTILSYLNKEFIKDINYAADTDQSATKNKVVIKKSTQNQNTPNQQKISDFFTQSKP